MSKTTAELAKVDASKKFCVDLHTYPSPSDPVPVVDSLIAVHDGDQLQHYWQPTHPYQAYWLLPVSALRYLVQSSPGEAIVLCENDFVLVHVSRNVSES